MAIKVYIDQGHNPENPNAGAEGNGLREQDITYKVGKQLETLFQADPNFSARVSRETEETQLGSTTSESLAIRVDEANAWGANLFLSIHVNAFFTSTPKGSEALVYDENTPAVIVAEYILEGLAKTTGLNTRGIFYRPGLYVLRKTKMPAVLVELGFISNPIDAEKMKNDSFSFAQGIYDGVITYYGLD